MRNYKENFQEIDEDFKPSKEAIREFSTYIDVIQRYGWDSHDVLNGLIGLNSSDTCNICASCSNKIKIDGVYVCKIEQGQKHIKVAQCSKFEAENVV